jgi:hypothetical protein
MAELSDVPGAFGYGDSILVGERVRLRGVRDDDLPALARWEMDPGRLITLSNWVAPPSEAAAKERVLMTHAAKSQLWRNRSRPSRYVAAARFVPASCPSVGVLGRSAQMGPPAGGGPPEPAALSGLFQPPAWGLFGAVIASADRSCVAQAGSSALLIRGAVFIVARLFGAAAGRERAAAVEDPGQMPEFDSGVVSGGLVAVVAWSGQ